MSWPLVERRRRVRSQDPTGHLEQLTRANELLLALQKMAVTLSSSLDPDEVVDRGVENARRVVGADTIIVLLRDPVDGGWAVARGPDEVRESIDSVDITVALRCLESERPHATDGATIWSRADHGLYHALRARGQVLGVIAAEWTDDRRPSTAEREAIVGVADALALALDNARIFGRLAERAARDERSRVARELHDRVSGSLAAIGFELDDVARTADDESRLALARVREHLGSTISDVRRLLDDLRTEREGSDLGESALRRPLDDLGRRSGIRVRLDHRVDPDVVDALERDGTAAEVHSIVREALLNVERHSGANSVSVSVIVDDDHLIARVADDGRGFDAGHHGHGISGMRERADWIGATLDIESSGDGTRVTVRLPLGEVTER